MSDTLHIPNRPSRRGEPLWEALDLLPDQGEWSEAEYLNLNTNKLVEFTDGVIEVLPMPTYVHQTIAAILYNMLRVLQIDGERGIAVLAAFKLKIRSRKWREPDVLYLKPQHKHLRQNEWWTYADFVVEIVSDNGDVRDFEEKRQDYAELGVPEYWIIDPRELSRPRLMVLVLRDGAYVEDQVLESVGTARSVTVAGLTVDLAALMAEALA